VILEGRIRFAGENVWAGPKGYLDEIAATAAAPVIEKYSDVIAAWTCSRRARHSR
jgi:hypothetical protein